MAMTPFTGQVIAFSPVSLNLSIKQDALINKPLNAGFSVAGDKRNGMAIAKAGSGNQRIFYMGFNAVGFIEDGGDPALSIESTGFGQSIFRQYRNR